MAYTPPGVSVNEITSPNVSPLLASPADICLVGVAGTYTSTSSAITQVDTFVMSGTSPITLPTLALTQNAGATLVAVQSVKDTLNPSVGTPLGAGYVSSTDYSVNLNANTISRLGTGNMPNNTLVTVTYTYYPANYWQAIRLFDIGSVEARFGLSWATSTDPVSGQTVYSGINSQLSMAARIAFENGAQSVICQPLFQLDGLGNPQAPSTGNIGNAGTWTNTLQALRSWSNLNVIVPVVGQDNVNVTDSGMLNIFGAVQSHLAYMNTLQQYIVAIFGEDGTVEGVGNNTSGLIYTLRNGHAASLQSNFGNSLSSQCVLINNTVFDRPTPSGNNATISVGGQYAAAAVAGALGSRPVSASLTRKAVLGFSGISKDPRTPQDKNSDAAAGLMVLEQIGQIVRCRQAITLDVIDGPAKSELSVVRAKFLLMESIRATLDNQIIGNIIADAHSPLIVRSAITSVLSLLQQSGTIVGYSQVQAQLSSLNPATITATFSYQPSFVVNNIVVTFNLDLTSGAVTTQTGASGVSQG